MSAKTPDIKYYDSLPKKRMAAGALLFNSKEELLLVKPTYKESWEIPGGVVEENESPLECCKREIAEELSLQIKEFKLLLVDYDHATHKISESLHFIFTSKILINSQIEEITIPREELSTFGFYDKKEVLKMLGERLKERVSFAFRYLEQLDLKEKVSSSCSYSPSAFYLENQELVSSK